MHTGRLHFPLAMGLGATLVLLAILRAHSLSAAPATSIARVLRVATTGQDLLWCGTIDLPCRTIQYAVDLASAGDRVLVARGTFTDVHSGSDFRPPGFTATQIIFISKDLAVEGGYSPYNWDEPRSADSPTVLDAMGRGRVAVISGPVTVSLTGLRLTGGNATGLGGGPDGVDAGGGLYLQRATAILTGNVVSGNSATLGGGVFLSNTAATLRRNTIYSNTAASGGGLYLYFSDALLEANSVLTNTAVRGGGIYVKESDGARLEANTIRSNRVFTDGGGVYLLGSGASLRENLIAGNHAEWGGGVRLDLCDGVLALNTIISNTAAEGGGMHLDASRVTLYRNTVKSNTASGGGGGIRASYSTAVLDGNRIRANTASHGGGIIVWLSSWPVLMNNVVSENRAHIAGSGVYIWASSSLLVHNTIASNTGGDGAGIALSGYATYTSTAEFTNTIVASQTVGVCADERSTARLRATLWGTGTWSNGVDWLGSGITSTVSRWGMPAFTSDYRITGGSAALDAGVDAGILTDVDGQPRPLGDEPDIGAHELTYVRVSAATGATLAYTDSRGFVTALYIPSNVVTATTLIAFTPVELVEVPPALASAGPAFDLNAYRNARPLPDLVFEGGNTSTLTLQYQREQLMPTVEESLAVYRQSAAGWLRVGADPLATERQELNTTANILSARLTRLGRFGYFGTRHRAFLPAVVRR